MNFTYDSSGSAQQILWAQNAIAACTYPLANININVGFFWVSALPTTVHGLLMLTQALNDGSFKILINNRADDPNASHLVGGLDNPPAEIQRFYMESVIHELGHVVHYNLLGSDTGKEDVVCGTLEIPQPLPTNGYRVGDHTDYAQDPPTILWADSVKEGIAEVFKDMTYDQRVYDNRSNWKLRGTDQVTPFGQGLSVASVAGAQWFDDFSTDDISAYNTSFNNTPPLHIAGGVLRVDLGASDSVSDTVIAPLSILSPCLMSVKVNQLLAPAFGGTNNWIFIQFSDSGPPGASLYRTAGDVYYLGSNSSGYATLPSIVNPTFPLWLAVRRTATTFQSELWSSDPTLGGTPILTYGPFADTPDSSRGSITATVYTNATPAPGAVILDDFRYAADGVASAPWNPGWPYADSQVALGDHNSAILRMKNQIASSKLALTTR